MKEYTIKQLSTMLGQQAERVASHLFPNGKMQGSEFKVGDILGSPGQSLSICVSGTKAGVWCDFASDTSSSGDLIDLWRLSRNLTLPEALTQVKDYLGVANSENFTTGARRDFTRPALKQFTQLSKNQKVLNYLHLDRKLSLKTLELFKIRSTVDEIIFPFYKDGELRQIKYLARQRIDGKKKIRVEANCEPCLFGWQAFDQSSRVIALTEGEIDAMSLCQYGYPALSLPFGGGIDDKHRWLQYEYDRISHFDEIYLCFDNDLVGHTTTKYLIDRLGAHRCRIVTLPCKDANECLQNNVTAEEINNCFKNAKSLDPDELKQASSFVNNVIDEFYPSDDAKNFLHLPWEKARNICLYQDELSIWVGQNGHGKSQIIGQIALHFANQGKRLCIASLELKPQRLLKRLTCQAGGLSDPSIAYIKAIHEWYNDKLWIFDLVGTAKAEKILEVFLYARKKYGVDIFIIDSFMKCGIDEDDYNSQKRFIEQLCDFKNQYNCQIHLINHPRKLIDEKHPPGKMDIKGTGAISDLADNCFTIWRNKSKQEKINDLRIKNLPIPAELEEQYDCLLCCDKSRNNGWEGKISLWYHTRSLQFLNHKLQKPIIYVPYSKARLDHESVT